MVTSCRVIVRSTPGLNVATVITATQQEADTVQGDCTNTEDLSAPPENFQQFAAAGFDVDWCQYRVCCLAIHELQFCDVHRIS